jgi:hypothetical protein
MEASAQMGTCETSTDGFIFIKNLFTALTINVDHIDILK